MKPLTIKELKKECDKQIKLGNADKIIMISDDDEGNGYHYLWYVFSTPEEIMMLEEEIDEKISTKENTIILG